MTHAFDEAEQIEIGTDMQTISESEYPDPALRSFAAEWGRFIVAGAPFESDGFWAMLVYGAAVAGEDLSSAL